MGEIGIFNFNKFAKYPLFWKIIRFPLILLPDGLKIPIIQGKLRTKRWIIGSSTHDCWLGCYESEKQQKMEKVIKKGSIFYDIGANVGIYTLLASVLVGPQGHVYAFEPVPRNLKYLYQHLKINKISNVTVYGCAVSDRIGQTSFDESKNPSEGKISPNGKILVDLITLDELYIKGKTNLPHYLKIDVEGAEYQVLTGAIMILKKSHPIVFLATHGTTEHQDCCKLLLELGYHLEPIGGNDISKTKELFAF